MLTFLLGMHPRVDCVPVGTKIFLHGLTYPVRDVIEDLGFVFEGAFEIGDKEVGGWVKDASDFDANQFAAALDDKGWEVAFYDSIDYDDE